jgi:hypothetical protein
MANQEHLDLLRQGVEQWNVWRGQLEYYTTMVPDPFGDDDSSDIPMSGSRLRAADLREADLRNANMRGTNLRNARLNRANLSNAWLMGAILQRATWEQITLTNAHLERVDLRGIPWPLIMGLTVQPGIIWKDVLYDHVTDEEA